MVVVMDSKRPSDVDIKASSDLSAAASYLLRGGSLLSSPCAMCNGVQIKYKGDTICINCGNQQAAKEKTANLISKKPTSEDQVNNTVADQYDKGILFSPQNFENAIGERIAEQFKLLKFESNDIYIEKQRIELIGMYLDLLDRLRKYPQKVQK